MWLQNANHKDSEQGKAIAQMNEEIESGLDMLASLQNETSKQQAELVTSAARVLQG